MSHSKQTIVHYTEIFLPVTENWIYHLIRNIPDWHHIVYCRWRENAQTYPWDSVRSLWNDLKWPRLFVNRGWHRLLHIYPEFLPWLKQDRPPVVHAHFGPSGWEMAKLKRWIDFSLVTTFYGFDVHRYAQQQVWRTRYKELFRAGDLFLIEGNHMRDCLTELGCPPEKARVQRIGIECSNYRFQARSLPKDGPVKLLIVGRFEEKKGIPYAIEAVKMIHQNTSLDILLTIVGDSDRQGTLTPEKRRILDAVQKHSLECVVEFTGYLSHEQMISKAYDHHILVVPSVHAQDGDAEGGAPVIILEMMATGMPVMATYHCDIPNIVQDGESGFLVPERDATALARRLEYLIERSEHWPEMGQAGRKFVKEHHDIKKLSRQLAELYGTLLAKRAAAV